MFVTITAILFVSRVIRAIIWKMVCVNSVQRVMVVTDAVFVQLVNIQHKVQIPVVIVHLANIRRKVQLNVLIVILQMLIRIQAKAVGTKQVIVE